MTLEEQLQAEHAALIRTIRAVTAPVSREPGQRASAVPSPEVVVAMPAYNAGAFVREAVLSVLGQEGIELEVVVVDDGSVDDTATVVRSIRDPRVRLLRSDQNRGIGASHNAVLAHSAAPYIAHVDADDFLLPGALRKVVDALARQPRAGQAYAYHYELNRDGWLSVAEFARQRRFIPQHHGPQADYRRNLIVHGMVVNHLRVYRRTALELVGRFDERRRYGVDYDMALRIATRFDIVAVPEFLYCLRSHAGNTQRHLRFRALRFWWDRLRTCGAMVRSSGGSLMGRSAAGVYALLALGLIDALRPGWSRD